MPVAGRDAGPTGTWGMTDVSLGGHAGPPLPQLMFPPKGSAARGRRYGYNPFAECEMTSGTARPTKRIHVFAEMSHNPTVSSFRKRGL
jgi:hypothetical protein